MAATGAPADEAIKATQHLIDTTLDEVEKILLRLPPRRVTTTIFDVHTTESSATTTAVSPATTTAVTPATTTAVSPATTTAHSSQLATAHSSEVKITKQQSQSTSSSTVTTMTPEAKTAVSPATKRTTSPAAKTASSTHEQYNRSDSTLFTTAVSPDAKTAVSPPTEAATSPVVKTASSTREQHNRSESTSLTTAVSPMAKTATSPMAKTAVSPMAKTAVSPMARTAHFSGRRQRSHSASSAISQTSASTSTGDVRTATTPSVCPNTAPLRPKSFVIPQPRTSTPIRRPVMQSSSSMSVHTAQMTSGNSTAVSPIAKTAHSPMAKTAQSPMARTAHSTVMASETSVFVLQGPVTVTSQENVIRRQDGMVNVNELIELRGAGATGMPTNELQPRIYSRAAPTSAKGAVDSKETVKVGDNVMHIQRSIAINPAGPPSEFALKELRIYSQEEGTTHEPTTSNSPAQLVRLRSEQEGGGVDIEFNINVKRSKGASTTPAKIKCDCPGFIPKKVWVNDRQVWTAAGN